MNKSDNNTFLIFISVHERKERAYTSIMNKITLTACEMWKNLHLQKSKSPNSTVELTYDDKSSL